MPPPDPTDPHSYYYWPEAPPSAHFDRGNHSGTDPYGWTVQGLPPEPWPFAPHFTVAQVGPGGTTWRFSAGDFSERLLFGSSHFSAALAKHYLRLWKLPEATVLPIGPVIWTTPGSSMGTFQAFRVTIHAKVGTVEEASNILHYQPLGSAAFTTATCQQVAANMVVNWTAFLETIVGGLPVKKWYSPDVVFDEVRCAAVTISPPAKPHYDVLTEYSAFVGGEAGTGGLSLPWEVAAVISTKADNRARSARGRTYLGPLSTDLMGSGGLFDPTKMHGIAQAFGDQMVAAPATAALPLKLVVASGKYGIAYEVAHVNAGLVPDSQRRRRKSQPEQYAAAWPH